MPPIQAKRTIEAVSIILGLVPLLKSYDWDDVRKALRDRSFIPNVISFEPRDMDDNAAEFIRQRYLYPSPEFLEKLNAREREKTRTARRSRLWTLRVSIAVHKPPVH